MPVSNYNISGCRVYKMIPLAICFSIDRLQYWSSSVLIITACVVKLAVHLSLIALCIIINRKWGFSLRNSLLECLTSRHLDRGVATPRSRCAPRSGGTPGSTVHTDLHISHICVCAGFGNISRDPSAKFRVMAAGENGFCFCERI